MKLFTSDKKIEEICKAGNLHPSNKIMDIVRAVALEERRAVLHLFDGELGFCHDPMGQEALDRLQKAVAGDA